MSRKTPIPSSVMERRGGHWSAAPGDVPPHSTADLALEGREQRDLPRKLILVSLSRLGLVSFALVGIFVLSLVRPRAPDLAVEGWQYTLIAVTFAFTVAYALVIRVRRFALPLAYAQIGLDSLIVTVLVLMTGGVESVFSFSYVFVVIAASITLYRQGVLIASAAVWLLFGTLVGLQVERAVAFLPAVPFGNAMFSFIMFSVATALVGVLSSFLSEKIRATRQELAATASDLEELEELHVAILRSLPTGLLTVDQEGIVRYSNDAALGILRLSPEMLVGQPLILAVPAMGSRWSGTRLGAGELDPVRDRLEESFVRPDGAEIRIGFSFAPLGGVARPWSGSIVVFQDVTEIVRLKEGIERAERLATVGKLAAGLAHEVRNPLASMCASIDVLKQAIEPPEPLRRLMENVVSEAARLNSLITDFLTYARPRELSLRRVDLTRLVSGIAEVFGHDELMEGRALKLQMTSDLEVELDEDLIRQVLWNVLRNAAEAMSDTGGTLSIETRRVPEGVAVAVRDTGRGISPEQIRRIFDPFYTTKQRGSGLGLAISHSIVEAHEGVLSFESKEGEGSVVTILLPQRHLDSGRRGEAVSDPAGPRQPALEPHR